MATEITNARIFDKDVNEALPTTGNIIGDVYVSNNGSVVVKEESFTINGWVDRGIVNGAASVNTVKGTGKTTKNRRLGESVALATIYADATNLFTHTANDDVAQVVFTFRNSTINTSIPAGATIKFIPDGMNEAARTLGFAETGGASTDVEYVEINLDDTTELRYTFTGYLSDIAFLPSVTGIIVHSVNQ